ncbi:M23 family metallopeptidase [Aneurinibacillus terranovensis]|uniref:M23 family metallopeptidase n=1 Tax=Aneurinibacillus terranovensis TaxID=278991 RepID=UPI0004163B4E|nr:M23 family metallopeptidase [Aneurinibacillus terranovensis]
MRMRALLTVFILCVCTITYSPQTFAASKASDTSSFEKANKEKLLLFQHMQTITGIPWYYLAAVERYESNINKQVGISFSPAVWAGMLNPNSEDTNPQSIEFFGGIGKDGDGDGKADSNNQLDAIYTMACFLAGYGYTEDDIHIALWNYYGREKNVDIISEFASVYHHFNTLNLTGSAFPIPLHYNYSYRSTWGDPRGWGGRRIHEGTDIFASYGTPVRATRYGVIEIMGWNVYGGWRIGIRDLDNIYHYYGHLNGFNKKFKIGDIVKPGDVIGYVGSSGYGKPGTAGKFPPHLHYGMYKDNGKQEWSYDPYPSLKKWEWAEKKKRTSHKKRK